MSLLQMLNQFFLEPLTLLLEMIYGAAYEAMDSFGAAIIPLSMAVNLMLLPFYKRADALQAEERRIQARMKKGLAHIKATFSGDERYMMQLAYYRQNHYKPLYSLRSILPLMLEVPFFIAAYQMLSHVDAFKGQSFGGILPDLGAPDQLLTIGSLSLNLLPILMTVINMISSEIYTKGAPLKEKLSLHGMALLFLLLLYNSPSALVFYWTLNNLFSLVKNIVARSRKPGTARAIAFSLLGAVSIAYGLGGLPLQRDRLLIFLLIGLLLQIPSVRMLMRRKPRKAKTANTPLQGDTPVFFISGAFLTILTGLLIPTATIVSSPAEFMLASAPTSPLRLVLPSLLLAAGAFLLWGGLFYALSSEATRRVFTISALILAGISITNYLFFGDLVTSALSPLLQYEMHPFFLDKELTTNFLVVLFLAAFLYALWEKRRSWAKLLLSAACMATLGISAYNALRIQQAAPTAIRALEQAQESEGKDNAFLFSENGENVVVIVLDRAVGAYLPYLFNERPQLAEQFDGFTWYPNTLSYGQATITGSPAIYGGYDYRPDKMNARSDELLVDKHNEALKTMPLIFSQADWQVTVCDPPYANYNWMPDISLFDEYPEISCFLTESGQYAEPVISDGERQRIWNRNFFCFGLMKASPLLVQSLIYQNGFYYDSGYIGREYYLSQNTDGISRASGYREDFMEAWQALRAYPSLTKTSASPENSFLMLYNSTAHNTCLLKEPEYEPALRIDNSAYDAAHADRFILNGRRVRMESEKEMSSYQCNMAALIGLGNWFDDLRAKGVYDNTRIILVSDHGALLGSFSDMVFGENQWEDAMAYNPLLMVKDFGDRGFMTDERFMTNADTPSLAFADLINEAVSPFTERPINSEDKKEAEHLVFYTKHVHTSANTGTAYAEGEWLILASDDIFDMDSWRSAEEDRR